MDMEVSPRQVAFGKNAWPTWNQSFDPSIFLTRLTQNGHLCPSGYVFWAFGGVAHRRTGGKLKKTPLCSGNLLVFQGCFKKDGRFHHLRGLGTPKRIPGARLSSNMKPRGTFLSSKRAQAETWGQDPSAELALGQQSAELSF